MNIVKIEQNIYLSKLDEQIIDKIRGSLNQSKSSNYLWYWTDDSDGGKRKIETLGGMEVQDYNDICEAGDGSFIGNYEITGIIRYFIQKGYEPVFNKENIEFFKIVKQPGIYYIGNIPFEPLFLYTEGEKEGLLDIINLLTKK